MRKPHYEVSMDGSDVEAAGRLKLDIVKRYGGKCSECGEEDPEVLEVRPQRRNGQLGTWYWLRSHQYPSHIEGKEVKLVCGNCKVRKKRV